MPYSTLIGPNFSQHSWVQLTTRSGKTVTHLRHDRLIGEHSKRGARCSAINKVRLINKLAVVSPSDDILAVGAE